MYAVAAEIEESNASTESLKQLASSVTTALRPIIDHPLAPAATLKQAGDAFRTLTTIVETVQQIACEPESRASTSMPSPAFIENEAVHAPRPRSNQSSVSV